MALALLAAALLAGAASASASSAGDAPPGGFLSYSAFAGTPYTVTYDNRRCVARGVWGVHSAWWRHAALPRAPEVKGRSAPTSPQPLSAHCRRLLTLSLPLPFARSVLLNGQRAMFASAGIHYPRFTPGQWDDVLLKVKVS